MDDRLRNLWSYAADDALRTHQSRRGYRLQQMLRDQGVHRRHTSDVDDREVAALSTIASSRFCITIWVLALSSVPISGNASTPSRVQ